MERETGTEDGTGKKAEIGTGERLKKRQESGRGRDWKRHCKAVQDGMGIEGKTKGQTGVEETGGEMVERLANQTETEVGSQGLEFDYRG